MSAAANWSYTASATLWPWLGRDDWTGQETFGPPVVIACDYAAESKIRTDDLGREFTSRQVIYTERADVKMGDRVLIGEHANPSPIVAGAWEVRAVKRSADTFDRIADDYELVT